MKFMVDLHYHLSLFIGFNMSHERIQLGKKGEGLAARYLKQQGYQIYAQNYFCKHGEIDIIAHKDNLFAFVEVKVRNNNYCNLSEIVTYSKRHKIITTARLYLCEHNYSQDDYIIRFDIILLEPNGTDYSITYVPNAFTQLC